MNPQTLRVPSSPWRCQMRNRRRHPFRSSGRSAFGLMDPRRCKPSSRVGALTAGSERFQSWAVTCRICGGATAETFRSERCPRASQKFTRAPVPASYEAIAALRCRECGTVQLDRPYEGEYADDYQRNTSCSPSAVAFMRENAEWLSTSFPPGTRPRALEIGCGDGSFLDMLRDRFDVEGVEPSRAAAELAHKKGLPVRNEYFDPAGAGGSYDAVVL